ncbi:MAG: DUF4304 domain-containing protein [Verrucomicrobia bacterium]|nr:DUF4304 domain-containing protein [Verrucomicrobiota bacterium]
MSVTQEKYETLMLEVDTLLKPEGFRRTGQNFRKRLPDGKVRWSIIFEKHRRSTEDEIRFTFYIGAEWNRRPADYEDYMPHTSWYGGAGDRIGYFMPKKEDTWWEIDEGTTAQILSAQIKAIIWSCALPFIRQFETEKDIEDYQRSFWDSPDWQKNYPTAIERLACVLRENRDSSEIAKRIDIVRRLGRSNGVSKDVTEATIQRVLKTYGITGGMPSE